MLKHERSTTPPSTYSPINVDTTTNKNTLLSTYLPEVPEGGVTAAGAPPKAFLPIEPVATSIILSSVQTPPDGNIAVEIRPASSTISPDNFLPPSAFLPIEPAVTGTVLPDAQAPPDRTTAVEIRPASSSIPLDNYLPSPPFPPIEPTATSTVLPDAQTPPDGNTAVEIKPASSIALTAYLPMEPAATSALLPAAQAPPDGTAAVEIRPATVNAGPTPGGAAAGLPVPRSQTAGPDNGGHDVAGFQGPGSQGVGGDQGQSSVQLAGSAQTPNPQTGEINGATYSIGPSDAVVNGKTIDYATPTTVTVASGKAVVVSPSGDVAIQDIPDQLPTPRPRKSVTKREYLIGAFLPTVLAVLFSIPWYILFTAVQEMEPFYQLANPQGALARDSICLDYRAYVNVVSTVKAGLRGHFVVLWAGLCSIAVLALAPLASETVFIGFVGEGRCTATSSRDACHPQLSVYPVAARAVQGILSLVAVLTICIAITISRRNSGVYANPSSIAGIATLFQNQTLIDEFRQLDPDGFGSRRLEAQLQGNRYRLGYFQHRCGSMDYGIMRHTEASSYSDDTEHKSQYGRSADPNKNSTYTTVSVTPVEAEPTQPRKPKFDCFLHSATTVAFAVFVSGLLTLVVYYNQTGGDTGFERFMNSQTFGVAFLFSAVGVMLKMYCGVVDDDLRATNPHHLLLLATSSSASAAATESILASPPSNPFVGIVYSLSRMSWLPGSLSIVAVLTEPLIVALANIPFHPGTAYVAYLVSTYITIGVLSIMLLGLFGVLGRQRVNGELVRRGTEAARERTVGRVMGLVCGSSMLSEFRGLAGLDEKSRDEVVQGWGRGYRMGRLVGLDGVERWGVDEDIFVNAGGD